MENTAQLTNDLNKQVKINTYDTSDGFNWTIRKNNN